MKKLMLAVAVIGTAIVTQAANIQWSARNIYIPVAKDVAISEDGIVANSGNKFAADALTVSLYWVGNDAVQHYIGDYSTTGEGAISAQVLGNSSSDTALYTAMLEEGSTYKPSYYFTATYTTATGEYVYSGTAASSTAIGNLPSGNVSAAGNFSSAGTWSYTAAPEPTSGLLLLLGVAGMALRRRKA